MSKRTGVIGVPALLMKTDICLPSPAAQPDGGGLDADRLDYMADLVSELKQMAARGGFARLAFLLGEAEEELHLQLAVTD